MSKYDKLRRRILSGASDANIEFNELCSLLREYGFAERVSGSHHVFRKGSVTERPNLQRDGSKAKAYQVRQIRELILNYRFGEDTAEDATAESKE